MTRPRQKQSERRILENVLEALGNTAPGASSSFIEDESPDFRMGNSIPYPLGIEIIELHHVDVRNSGICLRQEEAIQERLCRAVERRWNTMNIPISEVSLSFLHRRLPSKQEELRAADAILEIVRENLPKKGEETKVSKDTLWKHPILGEFLYSLTVARRRWIDRSYVRVISAAFLPELSHDLSQKAFSEKNTKVHEYRNRCQALWLIVAHSTSRLSTRFSDHNSAVSDSYDLAFERTFLFNADSKELIEIKTL